VARALRSQVRQHGPSQPQGTKQVHLELLPGFGFRDFLDAARRAIPRVVDHHVEAPKYADGKLHSFLQLRGVGDVGQPARPSCG